jgi:hypothetical protein
LGRLFSQLFWRKRYDGERCAAGVQTLTKTVGGRQLTLLIPYRAVFTHGKPYRPRARMRRMVCPRIEMPVCGRAMRK